MTCDDVCSRIRERYGISRRPKGMFAKGLVWCPSCNSAIPRQETHKKFFVYCPCCNGRVKQRHRTAKYNNRGASRIE